MKKHRPLNQNFSLYFKPRFKRKITHISIDRAYPNELRKKGNVLKMIWSEFTFPRAGEKHSRRQNEARKTIIHTHSAVVGSVFIE